MTFNELITKIGVDKLLHFSIGGLITALLTIIVVLQKGYVDASIIAFPFIGLILVAILSWFKEEVIDDDFSWMDILASVLGAVPVFIATALGVLFYTLSN